jgi:hypothetical protein
MIPGNWGGLKRMSEFAFRWDPSGRYTLHYKSLYERNFEMRIFVKRGLTVHDAAVFLRGANIFNKQHLLILKSFISETFSQLTMEIKHLWCNSAKLPFCVYYTINYNQRNLVNSISHGKENTLDRVHMNISFYYKPTVFHLHNTQL